DQWREVFLRDLSRDGVIDPALFHEGNEERTGARGHADGGIEVPDGSLVRTGVHGARRTNDTDVSSATRPYRGAGAGLDDAEDGHRELVTKDRQRVRGRGVARDDDRFHVLITQERRDLAAVSADRVGTLGAIGDTRRVAEIHDALVRQLPHELMDDGETADARVEDADGTLRHATTYQYTRSASSAECGVARNAISLGRSQRSDAT